MTGWHLSVGALLCLATSVAFAQTPAYDTTFRTTYYEQKTSLYALLPNTKREIVFLGNSITDTAEWAELLGNSRVKNRGISGDTSFGVLARLDEVTASQPAKIFLMIGINDLSRGIPDSLIIRNYRRIVRQIREASPRTTIYLQSVLPTNGSFPQFARHQGQADHIRILNNALRIIASQTGQRYVDLHPYLAGPDGQLDPRFTNDGLHLNGAGYVQWVRVLHENHCLK